MKQRSRSDSQAWGKGDAYKALEKRLEGLELGIDKIESASGGTVLDQCGDACMQAGARERAVEYYGESIDAHLNEGYQELARGVAQKLIRVHPEGVRVFCTLTWIELGLGYLADAQMQLRAYVVAACRADRGNVAASHVWEMARTVDAQEFRESAAAALEELGDAAAAARMRTMLKASSGDKWMEAAAKQRCFRAAKNSGTGPSDRAG